MTQDKLKRILQRLQTRAALTVPAALYAVGLTLCLVLGQSLSMPAGEAAFLACIATLALCAVLYNRYTILSALVMVAAVALWIYNDATPQEWQSVLESLREGAEYVYAFLFLSAEYNPLYDSALYFILIGSCALLSALFIFRLRSAFMASMIGIIVFIVEWTLRGDEIVYTLWIIAIACAMLLAVRGFKRAPASAWQTVSLALVVALCAWPMSGMLVPEDTAAYKSHYVERAVDDVNDILSDYTGFQRPHVSFSLSWFGYQPLTDRLGGPVELPSHDVLRVNAVSPRLLRGTVRNYYTGQVWTDTVDLRTYRMGNPMIADRQENVFGLTIPPGLDEETRFATDYNIFVTHLVPMYSTMFTIGRVRGVLPAYGDVIPNFDEKGEIFAKRDLPIGSAYTVVSRLPLTNSSAFPSIMRNLYRDELIGETDPEIKDRNAYFFLSLYDDIPALIGETAREITADAENDYEKAHAIEQYLVDEFTYTLTPAEPPEDADFVEYFLQTKEGYCTYYASAMAVLARSVGLPSRYVEGFLLDGARLDQYGYIVTANQAHAWAEVYIEGVGWLPFDATPRPERPVIQANNADGNLEEEVPEDEAAYDLPEDIEAAPALPAVTWHIWLLALIPLALLITALILPVRLHRRRWLDQRLALRLPDPARRASAIWRDTLALLDLLGCGIEIGETPYAYAARIDEMVVNPAGELRALAETLVRSRFGNIPPTDDDLTAANLYRTELDLQYRYSAGYFRYLLRRGLRGNAGA